ncbi:hypothetical protein [Alkalihalobacillus sp. TS-13]|uniref:hypothetical protein n=1 Tax=Alkalihalobacillus sp. TS-13 TaxID=2842455 RepID=UPI001C86C648|nr:hypothetical protein [Alkalihalobacillus sp. TS-13]
MQAGNRIVISEEIQRQYTEMLVKGIQSGNITKEEARTLFQTAYQVDTIEYRSVKVNRQTCEHFAFILAKGIKRGRITHPIAVRL